jgi:hypothetical protein
LPYLSPAARERANWLTLPEAVAYVMRVERCQLEEARRQIREAIANGDLGPLRWEDASASPSGPPGGATMPLDEPTDFTDIDWQDGTAIDRSEFGFVTNPNVKYVTSFSPNSRSHWVMPGYRATYLPFGLVRSRGAALSLEGGTCCSLGCGSHNGGPEPATLVTVRVMSRAITLRERTSITILPKRKGGKSVTTKNDRTSLQRLLPFAIHQSGKIQVTRNGADWWKNTSESLSRPYGKGR